MGRNVDNTFAFQSRGQRRRRFETKAGQAKDATQLGDPGTQNWVEAFDGTGIHGVFILASDEDSNIEEALSSVQEMMGDSMEEVYRLQGAVRPGEEEGYERELVFFCCVLEGCSIPLAADFGYMDGIAQPAVEGFTTKVVPG